MKYRIQCLIILVTVSVIFTGCIFASKAPPGYAIELKDNSLLDFYAVKLSQSENIWSLSGRCSQGTHYQYEFRVIVSVEVVDRDGRVLEHQNVSTFPERLYHQFKEPGFGTFLARLQPPPPGAKVRLVAKSI